MKTNLASDVTSTQPPATSFLVGGGRRNFRFFRFFFPPSRGRRSNVDKVNVNVLWFVTGQEVEKEGVGGCEREEGKKEQEEDVEVEVEKKKNLEKALGFYGMVI